VRRRNTLQRWLTLDGVRFFMDLGLHTGDRVLDFGCGDGVYSIPAARVVGTKGAVYALDRDRQRLKNLEQKAFGFGLRSIVTVHDLHELEAILHGLYLDAVLLYDVIHSYYFTFSEREQLLRSIISMVRSKGLISIFPRHMDTEEIRNLTDTLNRLECFFEKKHQSSLMHDGMYTFDDTLSFRKGGD
jgi:ubiquinone/menaquinone biosynthesis C-methylase UbiE